VWLHWEHADDLGITEGRQSQFSATVDSTLNLLDVELTKLGASEAWVASNHVPGERLRDGRPGNRGGAVFGAIRLRAGTKHGELTWTAKRYARWEDNLRAIALTLENLRAIDRYGATAGEQYRGFMALPAGDNGAQARAMICQAAGLTNDPAIPPAELVRRARIATHPDRHNGDRGRWDSVTNLARDLGVTI
jgi:hypothetical protein